MTTIKNIVTKALCLISLFMFGNVWANDKMATIHVKNTNCSPQVKVVVKPADRNWGFCGKEQSQSLLQNADTKFMVLKREDFFFLPSSCTYSIHPNGPTITPENDNGKPININCSVPRGKNECVC